MKKVSYIFLLSCILTLVSGHFLLFKFFEQKHKAQFREYLLNHFFEEKQTILEIADSLLYVNTSRITWLDDNKEIYTNGEMYDIIKIERKEKTVCLYLVHDKKEKLFYAFFLKELADNTPGGKNGSLLNDLLSLKFLPDNYYSIYTSTPAKISFFKTTPFSLSKGFGSIQIPPPIG